MFDSFKYWENRHSKFINRNKTINTVSINSINTFIKEKNIKNLFDYGCGDGRMAQCIIVENYFGVDVSSTAILKCKELNPGKNFYLCNKNDKNLKELLKAFKPDLSFSFSVISHVIEDKLFEEYMENLFCSERFVFINAINENKFFSAEYQKHRNFTKYIERFKDWKLLELGTKNEYIYEMSI